MRKLKTAVIQHLGHLPACFSEFVIRIGFGFRSSNFGFPALLVCLFAICHPATAAEQLSSAAGLAQIESKLAALNAAIALARTKHIDTSYEEVTAITARDFLGWIRWDLAHPNELTNFTAQWWVITSRAPELAAAIPGQEIADTLTILDRALADLVRVQQNPASRRPVPSLDGAQCKLSGDYCYAASSNYPAPLPTFLSSFVWMPEDADHAKAFGRLPSFYLTLRSLPGEGQGLPPGVLSDFKRRLAAYGRSGTAFDVFLDQSPPAWAVAKYPEITQGRRQFVGCDIDHPKVRELWQRYFAEVVPLIHEAAAGRATYMLANEPHWFTTQGVWSTGSVSEYTFQRFRQWLAARYHHNLAALNQRWQKQFASF
ncbi:MAG TPA: beta-galactosidase, partial [Bacillota bacterium]|nr:beta-galactosidase [Bacillota bacterium]